MVEPQSGERWRLVNRLPWQDPHDVGVAVLIRAVKRDDHGASVGYTWPATTTREQRQGGMPLEMFTHAFERMEGDGRS